MQKHIANMFFYVGMTAQGTKYIKIYSYKALIGAYIADIKEEFVSNINYSSTTTRHQGLTKAIISYFENTDFDIVVDCIKSCNTLKDLKRKFGYISKKYW